MSNVCQSAIAIEDFDPNAEFLHPPPGSFLVYKRGDTLMITKQCAPWVFGTAGTVSGWLPMEAVHIFPQRDIDDISDSPSLESDFNSLSLSSRKPSDGSATTDISEPAEMHPDLVDEVKSYTLVETASHSAVWVPYFHEGSVVYLDTNAKVMSRYLPFSPLGDSEEEEQVVISIPAEIPSEPMPLFESKMQSLSAVAKSQPCLYKNNDFYRFLRHVRRPDEISVDGLWPRICESSHHAHYTTWPELMEGYMRSIDEARGLQGIRPGEGKDAQRVFDILQNVTAHVREIVWAAHVPPGTYPSLGLGAISAAHRLMVTSLMDLHLNLYLGQDIGSLDDLAHSTIDFVALFHMTSGYPTIDIVPPPRLIQVSVLNTEWTDYLFELDAKDFTAKLAAGADEQLNTKQAMPLEAAVGQIGICHMVIQDITEKGEQLEVAVNNCINIWNEICEDGLQNMDGLQESSVSLFSSLHSVMAIYKSCVVILDCVDLRYFWDMHPRREDLSLVLNIRKEIYQALLSLEHSWARPHRSLRITDEYASAMKIVPKMFAVINKFPTVLANVVPMVRLSRWNPDNLDVNEVIFDNCGHLRAATKEKLVEHLTQHVQPRPRDVSAFLTTFPAFMKHLELVDLLQDRFSLQPATGLSRREFQEWEVHVQRPTRLRVVNMLRMWIESYWSQPESEDVERELFTRLEMLFKVMEVQQFPGSQRLHEMLTRRRESSGTSSILRKSSSSLPHLESILPVQPLSELSSPTQLSPVELARQLTLLEWVFYLEISPEDCLLRALEKPSRNSSISDFVAHWNKCTCWVSQEVLNASTPEERAQRIAYFVETAQRCREINNFSTMMSILSALSSAGIHRLRKTWAMVSKRTKETLEDMNRLMNSSRNFQEYRDILSLVSDAAVPFFGVCLMDLRFAQDGNSDHVRGDERLINFAKWSMMANIIDSTLRFQRMSYRLTQLPHIAELLHGCLDGVMSLNDQYPLSLEREARVDRTRPSLISRVNSHIP